MASRHGVTYPPGLTCYPSARSVHGDNDNGSASGSAYVFQRDEGGADAWGEVTKLLASDGASFEFFGRSVAVSGDTAVIGAFQHGDNGSASGSAYVFQRDEGGIDAWGEVKKLLASDGASGDRFGLSVAVSGDTVVVGAWRDEDNFIFLLGLCLPAGSGRGRRLG